MPYLHDVKLVRSGPVATLGLGLHLIEALKANGKEVDLGIIVNDLHMMKGNGKEGNPIRETFWNEYMLPIEFEKIIAEKIRLFGDLAVMVASERVLYNRLAHRRIQDGGDVNKIDEIFEPQTNITDEKNETTTKCIGALAYFMKFVRTLGCNTLIQIFPTCDMNSQKAAKAATEIYGADRIIPKIYFIYTTIGC